MASYSQTIVPKRTCPVAERCEIATPPRAAWAMVAGVPQIGQFLAGIYGRSLADEVTGPAVDANLAATNENGVPMVVELPEGCRVTESPVLAAGPSAPRPCVAENVPPNADSA
jgi:hypothetical protein